MPTLDDALKHHFGFESFRPLQREIAEASLAGDDVVALLPTGGGKSLCYQLPALSRPGLTLVISPLIALMKDQVDSLEANGIPATFLNSSIDSRKASERLRALDAGKYKLLYAAPERVVMPQFLEQLQQWSLSCIAVDEAHCVSEWGHDFRPEYRRIPIVREQHPDVPILALTATATERVRGDIERFLDLRTPQRFVASFNRPNLCYSVFEKRDATKQLLAWCTTRMKESGIVYVQSRNSAESLAEKLSAAGISALPYHAGLLPHVRARNQELFIRDEVRVICATIAFGMGIDKPNVRHIVHYDIPKTIEGYYQETGRAGRDGLASECALFFSGGDAAKQRHFIRQIENEGERDRAERLLWKMLDFAGAPNCRRAYLLRYFGESDVADECENCDNCMNPPERFDATVAAQKALSCVYRIRANGFATGMHHVIDVLLGSSTEKILSWRHNELSTYGIGKEHTKNEWIALISELLRSGCIEQDPERRTLTLTETGLRALKEKREFTFAKTRVLQKKPKKSKAATSRLTRDTNEEAYDNNLFEALRVLRKRIADEQGVPPYIVFSDATLREFAIHRPLTRQAFLKVSGVGDVKLERYGQPFVEAIRSYENSGGI